MSIMNTAVSGMSGYQSWLANISQNVANANSLGYKDLETDFSALVDENPGSASTGVGVTTTTRSLNSAQGAIQATSVSTDLAVQGAGFFVVSDASGNIFLTRNGSFVPDASGNLVNSAGYYLMAANTQGTTGGTSVNSLSQLTMVNISGASDSAEASTAATMNANLPSTAAVISAANAPAANFASPTAQYTDETTMVAYDSLGAAHTIDVYFTNLGPATAGAPNTWEVDAFDASTAAPGGGFPYSSGPLNPAATNTFTFNANGTLPSGSTQTMTLASGQTVSLDLSQTTQLATAFGVNSSTVNGNPPGSLSSIAINASGVLSYQYTNGQSSNAYTIPLANVLSPDNLTSTSGDAFQVSSASGAATISNAQTAGLGTIESSSLEGSTVDLATELTNMVQAQSEYQANSKVFQTGSDLLSILNNLK